MHILKQEDIQSNSTIVDLQEQLDRIRNQILCCVAEAKYHVKHVELLDDKVKQLSIEEEKLLILLEKVRSYRFCQG